MQAQSEGGVKYAPSIPLLFKYFSYMLEYFNKLAYALACHARAQDICLIVTWQ